MATINQMNRFVMDLGVQNVGCTPCKVYSAISQGIQSYHLFIDDIERFMACTLNEVIAWYWFNNSVHADTWEYIFNIFRDNGEEMYKYDERNVYLEGVYLCKMFELANYFEYSINPTLEGFTEENND